MEASSQDVDTQSKLKAQQQSITRTVLLIFGLHMSSLMITIDSKMMVYLNAFKDTAQAVNTNAKGMTLMLGSSLFVTPVMAAYSQASGRWPLFLIGGLSHVVMQLANLILPIPKVMLFTTSAGAFCNVTNMGAMVAIQDIFAGDPHGAGAAMVFVQAGQLIAATFSPMLGASLAVKSVRLPMAIAVVLSSIEVALLRSLPETLDKTKMRPMNLGGIHPFAFLKVFLRGPRLAALTLAYLITEMTDPLVQMRTASMAHLESLGWNMADCGRYTTASSMVSVPGFLKANQVGKALGTVPVLAMSGICIALHRFLEGIWVTKAWQQLALLPLLLPLGSTMASIKGLLLETGTAAGFHAGEMQGFISSLKSLAGFLGFPIWAALYARALRNKTPRQFFMSLAAAAFAQMLVGQLAATLPQPKKPEKTG